MFSAGFMRPKPLGFTRVLQTSNWTLLYPGQYAVTLRGGGGGGGGGDPFYSLVGEAGASGGMAVGILTLATNMPLTIGAGGAGGVASGDTRADGGAGAPSTILSNGIAVTAAGGQGGRGGARSYHGDPFTQAPAGNGGWGGSPGNPGNPGGPGSITVKLIG